MTDPAIDHAYSDSDQYRAFPVSPAERVARAVDALYPDPDGFYHITSELAEALREWRASRD
jgi:hypothetical protein